jgi:hypothetical protein
MLIFLATKYILENIGGRFFNQKLGEVFWIFFWDLKFFWEIFLGNSPKRNF